MKPEVGDLVEMMPSANTFAWLGIVRSFDDHRYVAWVRPLLFHRSHDVAWNTSRLRVVIKRFNMLEDEWEEQHDV